MELNARIEGLGDELKVLKSEVKSVLVEMRETLLKWDGLQPADWNRPPGPEPRPAPVAIPVAAPPEASRTATERPQAPASEAVLTAAPQQLPDQGANEQTSNGHRNGTAVPAHPSTSSGRADVVGQGSTDLLTVVNLMVWAEEAVRRVGKDRVAVLIELYQELNQGMPAGAKHAALRMIEVSPPAGDLPQASMRDYISLLLRLHLLMHPEQGQQAGVLQASLIAGGLLS